MTKKYFNRLICHFDFGHLVLLCTEGSTAQQYGFLFGIWHGICFPFALIGKVLSMDVGIYAENNTGLFYWVGYILGLSIIFGGGGASSRRRR
ncbi:MAG: hypothetical protein R2769_01655 [Saprospiraceae bacterium]